MQRRDRRWSRTRGVGRVRLLTREIVEQLRKLGRLLCGWLVGELLGCAYVERADNASSPSRL